MQIVKLAISKGAHIALEEIKWVDKRKGGPDLNKRFSMWNYASLTKRIAWLGVEIQKRPDYEGLSAPVCAYVSDYITYKALKERGERKEDDMSDDMFKAHVVFKEAVRKVIAAAEKREKLI